MTIPTPPRAARRPHRHEKHGDVRVDDYHWLRERDDPEVRAYLEAENAYVRKMTAGTAELEKRLFEEIKGRIRQTDMSVPYREGEYRYYHRFEDGRRSTPSTAGGEQEARPRRTRRALRAVGETRGGTGQRTRRSSSTSTRSPRGKASARWERAP